MARICLPLVSLFLAVVQYAAAAPSGQSPDASLAARTAPGSKNVIIQMFEWVSNSSRGYSYSILIEIISRKDLG